MNIPEEFRQMALLMHQDVFEEVKNHEELIVYLAEIPPKDKKDEIIRFIDELLASNMSGQELSEFWANAGADWIIHENGARKFFVALQQELRRISE